MKRRTVLASLPAAMALGGCWTRPVELSGAGATFPAPLYARWIALFERAHPEIRVSYRAIGSGGGIRNITAQDVDFGASDALLNPDEVKALPAPLLTIPTVLGAVVVAYNLPQFDGQLVLSGKVLADIYLGRILRWNEAPIAALNPQATLPDLPIHVAHRADSSGTTSIFTDYLCRISPEWQSWIGCGKMVRWPTDADLAGLGSDGIAHQIQLEPGGIGYLEVKYALNAGLPYATLVNRAGYPVRATTESVQSAELNTPATDDSPIKPSVVDAPGEDSYPLAAFSYLLVYRDLGYLPRDKGQALITFLRWCLTEGQIQARKLHYVPLPAPLQDHFLGEIEALERTVA
ncbi:phosphate ABC transporter substrate-binding protein PstS [Rhodovulum adriaticum]|uniref:Phosphate-binding protein PstS n=1 Tax=Rhodovulum adriaticum TaxID=35804 RepID=A0A4R2NIS7_RHOAD|nr:phosphate ABC transporter substrate-binding protein PstS [Rhodovulum adriaticum]TCP21115.1 phosphate ABC transporter substrate-binding protein (PhoT family) [Rhodovulum adriaticum]